ncbi:RHS repeat-associated core domain-containing protein, partial [Dictyobacter arantiisoli]|uniref:RHS repeat-associated core domain-containing protein n=1 Tax=Dictyobacter arantiisoli TaxID=2014874 RepID=UPI0011EC6DC4
RSLGSVTYQDASTIVLSTTVSYQLGNGLASFSRDTSTPFERTITQDAYNHQQISYSDALGRHRYDQLFSGTGASGSPYSTVRTLQYNRDTVGNLVSTDTFDASSNLLAYQTTTYDGVGRKTGLNDADSGSCTNTPLPAGCSSSADTAWKYNYDRNGNVLSQQDPRGQSTYVSYDVLNRALCKGTTSAAVSPCSSSASATFFYDSYDNTSNPGVTFPTTCMAPSGSYASDPIGKETAETFSATAGNGSRCSGYNQRGQADQSGLTVTADGTTTTQTVHASYNDMGQPTTLVYPDGEALTAQYDGNSYLRSSYFGDASSTDPVSFLVGQVSYTNTGQVSGLAIGGSATKASQPTPVFSTSATYDGIDRPVTSSATRNGSTFWSQTKTYDNVGNTLNLSTTIPTVSGGSQTDSQSFCYDALNRLVWAGDTGTPSGGDHCGLNPNGTTIAPYQQSSSYDALDRLTSGPAGTETYGTTPTHGATTLSTVPNQYASYDAMGNMTCRNTDTTVGSMQSCDASQSGALMSYDNEGRLSSWTAPGGTTPSDQFLYDNAGQRVLLYYNFRYYDSTSGRFTSADTVETNGSGLDPYAYVHNNPVSLTDSNGHCPWCIGAIIGAVVGAVADYGYQVYSNYQSGDSNPWGDVNWWDVGGAAVGGALIGATLGAAAPALADAAAAGVSAYNAGVGASGIATLAYTAYQYGPTIAADTSAVATAADTGVTAAADTSASVAPRWTESTVKDTLNDAGAKTTNADSLKLTRNENRLYLGHYGGNGTIIGGTDVPRIKPGLTYLDALAEDNGGMTLADLINPTIDEITPHIDKADEILFNIGRNGLAPGSLTEQEFMYILSKEQILQRTQFVERR